MELNLCSPVLWFTISEVTIYDDPKTQRRAHPAHAGALTAIPRIWPLFTSTAWPSLPFASKTPISTWAAPHCPLIKPAQWNVGALTRPALFQRSSQHQCRFRRHQRHTQVDASTSRSAA